MRMWEVIRGLVADGTTVLLTTQYLDEADALADRSRSSTTASSSPKAPRTSSRRSVGGERLEVTLGRARTAPLPMRSRRWSSGPGARRRRRRRLTAPVTIRPGLATAVIRALDDAGVAVDDFEIHHPSLDDVFFVAHRSPRRGAGERPTSRRRSRGGLT